MNDALPHGTDASVCGAPVSGAPVSGAPVSLRGVTKVYDGSTVAVEDVSFDVHPGTVTALIGANGAGKTTTLRMILGLADPTEGSVHTLGVAPRNLHQAPGDVGAVLTELTETRGGSAERELAIWAAAFGVSRTRVREVLELVDLADVRRRKVKTFSPGMKQRLQLAAALLPDPELLVLDEPSTGLDPAGIRWLRTTLRSLAAEGRTIVLSSHQLTEIERTVDHVLVLDRRICFDGPLDELVAGQDLEQRFLELTGSPA